LKPEQKQGLLFIVEIKLKDPNGPFCPSNSEMKLRKKGEKIKAY